MCVCCIDMIVYFGFLLYLSLFFHTSFSILLLLFDRMLCMTINVVCVCVGFGFVASKSTILIETHGIYLYIHRTLVHYFNTRLSFFHSFKFHIEKKKLCHYGNGDAMAMTNRWVTTKKIVEWMPIFHSKQWSQMEEVIECES